MEETDEEQVLLVDNANAGDIDSEQYDGEQFSNEELDEQERMLFVDNANTGDFDSEQYDDGQFGNDELDPLVVVDRALKGGEFFFNIGILRD